MEAQKVAEAVNKKFALQGIKVLLMGDSGTGKTHSVRTLVEAGLEVFAVLTEPCMDVIADIPPSKLKWHYISPSTVGWDTLRDSANKINTMSFETLTKLPHINRGEHAEFLQVASVMANYVDQRTGKSFGPTDDFDQTRCVWFDSLSGLSTMAMNLIAGSKPVKGKHDYGVAMDNLERFIQKFCNDLKCHAVMVGHKSRETDELTGGSSIVVSTVGQKLAPKFPQLFTDVIDAKRVETKFTWSTVTPNTVLKARNLPWADNMPATFVPLIEKWRARNEAALAQTEEGQQ